MHKENIFMSAIEYNLPAERNFETLEFRIELITDRYAGLFNRDDRKRSFKYREYAGVYRNIWYAYDMYDYYVKHRNLAIENGLEPHFGLNWVPADAIDIMVDAYSAAHGIKSLQAYSETEEEKAERHDKHLQEYSAWLKNVVSDEELFMYKDQIEAFKYKDGTMDKGDEIEIVDGQLDCIYDEIHKRGIYKADNAIYTVVKGGAAK